MNIKALVKQIHKDGHKDCILKEGPVPSTKVTVATQVCNDDQAHEVPTKDVTCTGTQVSEGDLHLAKSNNCNVIPTLPSASDTTLLNSSHQEPASSCHFDSTEFITMDRLSSNSTNNLIVEDSLYSDISAGDFTLHESTKELHQQKTHNSTQPKWISSAPSCSNVDGNVIIGKGMSTGIRTASKTSAILRHHPKMSSNRHISGVFISRLDSKTTAKQLHFHIKREAGRICHPEKLPTKFRSYSSFYIAGDKNLRAMLMDPYLWPAGTLIKPFYS